MRNGARVPGTPVVAGIIAAAAYLLAGIAPTWAQVSIITILATVHLFAVLAQADTEGRGTLLGRRALVLLGECSFASHLVHQLVVKVVFALLAKLGDNAAQFAGVPLSLVLTVIASAALYYWIEKPLEKRFRHARLRHDIVQSEMRQ